VYPPALHRTRGRSRTLGDPYLTSARYGSWMTRRPAALAALAALALAPWLANPAFGAGVEPGSATAARAVDDAALEPLAAAPTELPAPDWKGLRRDTWYFLGYQFVAVGVLYVMPETVTNFDRGGDHLRKWRNNVSNPGHDEDDHYINYVLHPYWGAAYYIRGRERGLTRWQSLGYSTLLSTLFEFGAEALFEKPSIQDLVVTPLIGSLIGEYVFSPLRQSIKSRPGGPDTLGKVALVLTDPLGSANDLVDRILGIETQLSLGPMRAPIRTDPVSGTRAGSRPGGGGSGARRPDGARPKGPAWGLLLDVRW